MRLDPNVDVEAKLVYKAFMAYMHEQEPRFHMSKEDFKVGLERATDGAVVKGRRTHGDNKGRFVFKGLTFVNEGKLRDPNGNVVLFPKMP
jgi:hypothetical protein